MASTIDYAAYIIDLTNAMLEHRQGLSKEQFHRINFINHGAVEFVTGYMQHETLSAPALLQYLTHDAQRPLRAILGNCKKLLDGQCGVLHVDYAEGVGEIHDCVFSMVDEIQQLCRDLQQFMATIGIED
ncbi:MAG: hypothetical protein Q9P44_08220 [Anaerolineae bacterium]|nr:hypothetical protein [Anaerolineae bacterium]